MRLVSFVFGIVLLSSIKLSTGLNGYDVIVYSFINLIVLLMIFVSMILEFLERRK